MSHHGREMKSLSLSDYKNHFRVNVQTIQQNSTDISILNYLNHGNQDAIFKLDFKSGADKVCMAFQNI